MARVLIIDDSDFMRMMLSDMVKSIGHEVIGEANNGLDGIEQYKRLKPDVVTMDITMPEMNGLDCLTGIMNFDPDAKVIMCSALGQKVMVTDAVLKGAKDFLIKPFQKERVAEALNKLV